MRQLVIVLAATLAACGGSKPAEPVLMQEQITKATPNLVDDLSTASASIDAAAGLTSLRASTSSLHRTFPIVPELGGLKVGSDDGRDFAKFLREKVFIQANYEGGGVYRLRGADWCPQTNGIPDAQCVKDFDAAELRVRAEAFGDHILLTLLVGPTRIAPLQVELSSGRIAVAVELSEAKSALQHIAKVLGKTIDLPAVMEGRVSVSLTRNGPQDFTFAGAVERAVRIEGTLPDDKGPFKFTTAARNPLWSLRVDGVKRTLSASVDLGPTHLEAPLSAAAPDSKATGTLALDLAGATGQVALAEGADSIAFTNLSLGGQDSTVKLDGTPLITVSLNPSAGRSFALTVTAGPKLAVSPSFDVSVAFDLRKLRDAGDSIAEQLLHQTYQIVLDGQSPQIQPIDPVGTFPGGIKVLSGLLTVKAVAESGTFAIQAAAGGSCLVGNDEVTASEHPVIGKLKLVPCP